MPESLAPLSDQSVRVSNTLVHVVHVHGLHFHHGHAAVVEALRAHERDEVRRRTPGNQEAMEGRPITWRFLRKSVRKDGIDDWSVAVSVHQALPQQVSTAANGWFGVDLNEDHVAVCHTSADGNILATWRIPLCLHGKTASQAEDLIRKAAAEIAALALDRHVGVASERLDFATKKARLETDAGPRRARMLSSLHYAAFDRALHSACARSGIEHRRVNPAYTSLIGRMKYARRFGLSTHAAACHSIARRAMGHSERVPTLGEITLPDGAQVTLLSLVKMTGSQGGVPSGRRHVWASWSRLATDVKATLAASARSNRALRAKARLRRAPAPMAGLADLSAAAIVQGTVELRLEAGPGAGPATACFTAPA